MTTEQAAAAADLFDQAIDHLLDVVSQACYYDPVDRVQGELDSLAISGYAHALRFLAELGYVEKMHEHGRRVIVRIVPEKWTELTTRIHNRARAKIEAEREAKDPPSCA